MNKYDKFASVECALFCYNETNKTTCKEVYTMKKIVSIIHALVMLMSMVPAAFAQEPVTVTFWAAWSLEAGMADMIAEFEAAHPEVKIEYVKYANNDEGNIAVDVALMAGDSIDMIINYGLKRLVPRSEKGLFEPLNAYAEKTGYDVWAENGDPSFEIDDQYFGLPIGGTSSVTAINGAYLEKAGLELPVGAWTTDQYKEYAAALTHINEEGHKIYGDVGAHNLNSGWQSLARGALGVNYWYKEDGSANFDNENFKKAMDYTISMQNEGIAYPYTEYLSTGETDFSAFTTGKAAMGMFSNAVIRTVVNAETVPEGFKLYFAQFPTLPGEKNYLTGINPFDYLSMCAAIPEERKAACWTFMEWLATEGNAWMASVAHIPSWKKVDKEEVVGKLLGKGAGKDRIDVESLMNVALNYDAPSSYDTNLTGYGQLYNLIAEYGEMAILGEMTSEEALTELQKEANKVLADLAK
jgi:multiple sugar transport system substrate-binding protein